MQDTLERPHAERLRHDLSEIRAELVATVNELGAAGLNWAPRPDMRTGKQLLQEIGAMEACSRRWITHQELPDWGAVTDRLDADTPEAILSGLEEVRTDTLAYLNDCTEDQMETPMPLPESWREYFGGTTVIEPEELLRWVARHEYYHLGQLNTFAMMRAAGPEPKA